MLFRENIKLNVLQFKLQPVDTCYAVAGGMEIKEKGKRRRVITH